MNTGAFSEEVSGSVRATQCSVTLIRAKADHERINWVHIITPICQVITVIFEANYGVRPSSHHIEPV
jgi:hypothetical protein